MTRRILAGVESLLWIAACAALGWCAIALSRQRLFQAREERILEEQIGRRLSRPAPPLAPPPEAGAAEAPPPPPAPIGPAELAWVLPPPPPARGDLLGRLEIPRLGVSSIICEGDDDATLRLCVGHIPGTALPSDDASNVALAGHRDSFFRKLGRLRPGDVLRLTTPEGSRDFRVEWGGVVSPEDTVVLDPSASPSLTLVTCYPFHFIGAAPRRYVVRAVSGGLSGG